MKYLVTFVVVVALAWFGFQYYLTTITPAPEASAPVVVTPVAKPAPVPARPAPVAPAVTTTAAAQPAPASALAAGAPAEPNPNAPIKIDLTQALGPGNRYHDAAVGLSATFPEGWTVRSAIRWGEGHLQNTVFLKPDQASSAGPSMYYKPYTAEEAAAMSGTGSQALLQEQAQKKEASRVAGTPDYKNVPDSFLFFEVNGSPAMTYFATFTRGDQVMTEHFIRVLGPKGYTMFFTSGKFEDVKAIMPQLKQTASTVKGP
ncbi:MAG: APA family fibronectin-binding glycoprotein [Verrucomicrobiota bacterium]